MWKGIGMGMNERRSEINNRIIPNRKNDNQYAGRRLREVKEAKVKAKSLE